MDDWEHPYESAKKYTIDNRICYRCYRDKTLHIKDDGTFQRDPWIGIICSALPPFKIKFCETEVNTPYGNNELIYCPDCLNYLKRYWDQSMANAVRSRVHCRREWEERQQRKREKRRKQNKRRRDNKRLKKLNSL